MSISANTLALLVIGVTNLITAALVFMNSRALAATAREIHKIEVATNSMKDALIVSTAKASHAAGREEMRAENASRQER